MGSFLEDFDEFLDCVFPKYDKFLICGDVNIQLDKKSAVSTEFVRILASYGLNQLINEPTHKAGHTLDMVTTSHKIIDNSTLQVLSDTLEIFKSCDHFPIIFTLQCKTLRSNDKKKIQFRSIEKIDKDRFSFDLLDKLARNKSFSTFEEHLDHYNATCSEVLDIHAPLLEKVIKDVPSAPWFDSEYKAARVARRKAEKVWLRSHLPIDRDIFNHLRLHCTELASSKKKLFFQGHFEKYSHSTKGLYKFVDVFLDNDAALKLPPTESLQDTVEEFNTFFTEKIKAIREAFSNSTLNEDPVAKVPVDIDSKLCEFRETSVEELKDILKKSLMHPVYLTEPTTPEDNECLQTHAFRFCGTLFGAGLELGVEFKCNSHNDFSVEPPIQNEGNSAVFDWFSGHTIMHDQSKFICKTCHLNLYKTYSKGSERSSPQVYTITFEILSQKIVSKKNDSLIRYLENKSLVNKRSLLTESDEAGLTLLHYSTLVKENSQITKYLIEAGAKVDTKDNCGVLPLHWACWHADLDTIEILIENISDIFTQDITGRTPLHYLCLSQNTEDKEQALKLFSDQPGFTECMKAQDLTGCTPLHYATLTRSYPCISLLLLLGADPNCSASTDLSISTTPSSLSVYSGDSRIVNLFKPRDEVISLLALGGDLSELTHGEEEIEKDGLLILHLAALMGRTELVAELLTKENKNIGDSRVDRTPLTWAVIGDHPQTVYYLLKQGCDPTHTDRYNKRALCYAVSHGWNNILRLKSSSLEVNN
ncbi:hypothetical protein ACHWQZ_G016105 [Mnemiopsis leidyi]